MIMCGSRALNFTGVAWKIPALQGLNSTASLNPCTELRSGWLRVTVGRVTVSSLNIH